MHEDGEVATDKFIVLVNVDKKMPLQKVEKLKAWMEAKAKIPIILNINIINPRNNQDNNIFGNGIDY